MLDRCKTPCIGVCSTAIGDDVCRGCKRFAHEVIDWNAYSEPQRWAIARRLEQFLAQIVATYVAVTDAEALRRQLDYQQLRYETWQDPHCWVQVLLKAGANQLDDLGPFGLTLTRRGRDMSLPQLRDAIDREYYLLSEAHYQRYIAPGEKQPA